MSDGERFILQDRDGDFVSAVEGTGWETVKMHFVFTKLRARAKSYTMDEMHPPKATTTILGEFVKGFAGGKVLKVQPF